MDNYIADRTQKVFSKKLIESLKTKKFCIVGCGAVGCAFAEMLVRSGAKKISFIDGEIIEDTNLNRVIAFVKSDVGKKKVDVLECRLKAINSNICIQKCACHLKELDPDSSQQTKDARDLVANSHIIINVPDTNRARIICGKLCDEVGGYGTKIKTLSIGIRIEKDFCEYECHWNPKTLSEKHKDAEGYGNSNGSYMAIVMEATSIGFMILLHHLENEDSKNFTQFHRRYENYKPTYTTCQ